LNQQESERTGGGSAQRDLHRYADRLAQQQQRGPQSYAVNGGDASGDRDNTSVLTLERGGGVAMPEGISTPSDKNGSDKSGAGTTTLSGANTYTGVVPSVVAQSAGNSQAANNQTQTGKLQISTAQQGVSVAPAVLASLEVDLHPRGVKYLFTTPRGEAEITAQAVSSSLVGRLVRLAGLAVTLLVVLVLVAAARRRRAVRQLGRA
jgi:hypothetical protein